MGAVLGTVFLILLLIVGIAVFSRGSKRRRIADQTLAKAQADGMPTQKQIDKLKAASFLSNCVRFGGLAVAAIAAVVLISICFTTVSAKNVGVAVNFGAVSSKTLNPGPHLKFPWTKVVEIDGTIQTDQYAGESCIKVTIGDGSQACAKITNRWQITPKNAAAVYEQHRSDDPTQSFRSAVISTELEQAISETLGTYNPISNLKIVGGEDNASQVSFVPDYDKFSKLIEANMKARLDKSDQAEIIGITFSHLDLSANTQKKLDDYIAAVGETRIAMQQRETAKAQADSNRELSASVSNDPNVLVSRCFDTLKDAVQNKYNLPAGFSCWPGGGSAVVVPKG